MITCYMILPQENQSQQCYTSSTPLQLTGWYSKRQATVETATYGSELVAARTATEPIMSLRYTLRYLHVPIKMKAYMLSDNKPVITSAIIPQSVLNKRHNMLSYHRVTGPIAAKILDFYWGLSDQNKVIYSVNIGNMQKSRTQQRNCLTTKCWKPSSLLSNVHFRNTTKIAVQVLLLLTLFTFTFEPFLKL